jgi:phosphate transport system substrate-binding protein
MKALLYILALLLPALAHADAVPLRIWGPPAMQGIAERWAEEFAKTHQGVRFEFVMRGSDTAIPGLYGGQADIALMGRANDIVDDNGFSRTMQFPFTRIEIANGRFATPGKSDAIAVLVSTDNPLSGLTLPQLARIVDCGTGGPPIQIWGELGLDGDWAKQPIRVHTYDFAMRTGVWLQNRVMGKSRKMCWDRIVEHSDVRRLEGTVEPAAQAVGEAARQDRYTLAIANPGEAHDGLKVLAIDGTLPDAATIVAQRYPLARRAYAFVARRPGTPLDERTREFLRFVLSPEGQALLEADHGYLPLAPEEAAAQLAIIEDRLRD